MGLVFQLTCLWLVASCVLGPLVAWAFFRQHRIERDIEEISSSMDRKRQRSEQDVDLSVVA